ncbi:hypothetical protein LSAT2_031187 [Lamellibrachia satsuma]|nr:hypothetical protein LSAT2_031187 [Lamellibrachia satsuma]
MDSRDTLASFICTSTTTVGCHRQPHSINNSETRTAVTPLPGDVSSHKEASRITQLSSNPTAGIRLCNPHRVTAVITRKETSRIICMKYTCQSAYCARCLMGTLHAPLPWWDCHATSDWSVAGRTECLCVKQNSFCQIRVHQHHKTDIVLRTLVDDGRLRCSQPATPVLYNVQEHARETGTWTFRAHCLTFTALSIVCCEWTYRELHRHTDAMSDQMPS